MIPPNVIEDRIVLSDKATDADLLHVSLVRDTVSWSDAGLTQSMHYSGLPPR